MIDRKRKRVGGWLLTALIVGVGLSMGMSVGVGMPAWGQEPPEVDLFQAGPPPGLPTRGIGLSVSFPLVFLPAGPPAVTSATVFLDLIAQGDLAGDLFHRTELRFFVSLLSGLRTDLTSLRESLLIAFTPSPAIFYIGGGLGVFPVEVGAAPSGGFLLSTLIRAGIEVQVAPIGLFLDVVYETMPQPVGDIQAAGAAGLVASAVELSVGVLSHF